MRITLAILLVASVASADSSDRYEYRNREYRPQAYNSNSPENQNIQIMTARLSFLQTQKVKTPPAQRFEMWKNEPLIQTAPPRRPDSFLAFVGKSLVQNAVELGRAIVSAVMRPIQAIKTIVAAFTKPASLIVPTPQSSKPTGGFTPLPPEAKLGPLVTPAHDTKPVQLIHTPGPAPEKPQGFTPTPQKAGYFTKGQGEMAKPGIMDRARNFLKFPRPIPIDKIYHEPGGDFYKRPGFDEDAIGRRRKEKIAGTMPPIEVIKVGDKFMESDGMHRVEMYRRAGRQTIPGYVIGRKE